MMVPLVLLAAQLSGSSEPRRIFAVGGKDVVMMLPQETVCGSEVGEMVWNATGTHLIAVRGVVDLTADDVSLMTGATRPTPEVMQRLKPRMELVVWSLKNRKSQTVLTSDAMRFTILEMQAMPGSDRVVVEMDGSNVGADGQAVPFQRIAILSPALGTLTTLAVPAEDGPMAVRMGEKRPIGALLRHDLKTNRYAVRLFGPTGVFGTVMNIPTGSFTFDENDRPAYITNRRLPDGKRVIEIHTLDSNSGREVSIKPWKPDFEAKEEPKPLILSVINGRAEDAKAPTLFLNVQGGKKGEAGVITTDGSRGLLSPKGDAVAYLSQGSAMVRRFARVDRKAYEAAMMAAQRTVALSNAKQAALALMMYAADMDDALPGSGDYNKIEPYLKNNSIMNAFTYTYAGGKMTDIDKPAETEIGYALGPGGRAVAYADGHVRWIPDAP